LSPMKVARLRIIEGDLDDVETLIDVLFPKALKGEPVNIIIYGIGGFRTEMATDIQGVMGDSYVSEEAIFTLIAALQTGYRRLGSKHMPRLISIGTISISRQIYHSWSPLAAKVRPLYECPIDCGSIYTDKSSNMSSDCTVTQPSYDRSSSSEDYDTSGDSSSRDDAPNNTEDNNAELMSNMEARSPDADKTAMEKAIWHHYHCFTSCLVVRPTLLTYHQPHGL
ncbi:hypothetical protein CI238_11215, partial [Colletotrichum incanum]